MRIIIDECTPWLVKRRLPHLAIVSVQERGWAGLKNGLLLSKIDGEFDVFITTDSNLRYQQNLSTRRFGVVVLPSNQVRIVARLLHEIERAVLAVRSGEVIEVPLPC